MIKSLKGAVIIPIFGALFILAGCKQKPATQPQEPSKDDRILANMPIDSEMAPRELVFADDMDAFIIDDTPLENTLHPDSLTQIAYNEQQLDFEPEVINNIDQDKGLIYFAYDSRQPASDQQENLSKIDDLAQTIYKQGDIVCVKGHACKWHGTAAYNIALSQDRSLSIKNHLVNEAGIPESHIKSFGVGNEEPVAFEWSLEGQAPNRRVEVYAKTA